jgi:hypothetical protein
MVNQRGLDVRAALQPAQRVIVERLWRVLQ